MIHTLATRLCRYAQAPTVGTALVRIGEYALVRAWTTLMNCFPVDVNLHTGRLFGRIWWYASPRHRQRALDNLRPALGDRYDEVGLRRIARESFEHFAQLYAVELFQTPRLIHESSWSRYVELQDMGPALRELLSPRGAVLLTGHFGNYELLGYTICKLGLPLSAVMRPLDRPLINQFLVEARARGGLTLLYKKGVSAVAGQVIDAGGGLSFIADQDAGRKGMYVNFFGRKASTYKSIGLLAMAKRVPIVVGYATRVRTGFHYRLAVERIIQPEEWDVHDDPLRWITQEFTTALEQAIRRWPEQYLWVHRRWKHRPKDETSAAQPSADLV
ncbi:MAG: lysophospholipid acyltransferase family protein [Phycisphaerales bacterium]|nr:lysophospholipid acyltransferase family protein [Phycisphaerales bacterium]